MPIIKKLLIPSLILIFSSIFIETTLASNISSFYYEMMTRIISGENLQDWSIRSIMTNNNNNSSNNMMSKILMNNEEPKDVIIKIISSQKIPFGTESSISFLVLDKESRKPLTNSQFLIGIERGASMTTMDMVNSMVEAKEDKINGSGIYTFKFTPDSSGYYTIHTHVIPSGKSMHSMMDNHLDIGIIVE